MPNYIRAKAAGATYFFTVALAEPGSSLLVDRIDELRAAFLRATAEAPVRVDAMVVLPDHLHAVWTLPPGDNDFSGRWKRLKGDFTKMTSLERRRSFSKHAKGEKGVWQRRFWEHMIRDKSDFVAHVQKCWADPVKHGLADRAFDWPYSSFRRDVRLGIIPFDWAAEAGGSALLPECERMDLAG